MSNLAKGLVLVGVILAVGIGLVIWKNTVGGHGSEAFNRITREEVELLLADVAKANPMAMKRLAEDPEMKKQQLDNLRELLAFASEAQRTGLADTPENKQELENIRAEIVAVNYDREINKDKGPMPPFGMIGEDRIKEFWGQAGEPADKGGFFEKIGLGGTAESRTREAEFEEFLNTKVNLMKASNPQMKDREISEEEKTQAKDFFARVRIYENEYDQKVESGELGKEFQDKVNLQVKLQQAQFLARQYADKLAEEIKVTDEDIAKYIAEHPELDPAQKKAKAEEILNRAKAGEDFAALANEFSEDPGNRDRASGEPKGGLYEDVATGQMVKPFEEAALALEPGQVAPNVVESDFGYHIIKLEKKEAAKGSSGEAGFVYDVRHILISTGVKDPENPMAREMPVKQHVRQILEKERREKAIADIVARNNVSVPDDFTVPQISDEEIQEMIKQQQGPPAAAPDGESPEGQAPAEEPKPEPQADGK